MKKLIKHFVGILLLVALVGCMTSCGTIIYPERRGQKTGHLDGVVVLLDGIGCLFFILPGVAAFIVDFQTGAIYLPPGHSRTLDTSGNNFVKVSVNRRDLNRRGIERVVSSYMGRPINISDERMQVNQVKSSEDLRVAIASVSGFGE
ncbi:MAG: polyribonucleotide nucleotidyltransferase [Kiritimatiellae bacterium]|nr:polyribonucleotide nucleotidyltransferase [Kiritimatiellia bacterium]MDD5522597.1 polyribonucleotide nucleotidyltransferase [Kiritimatiellia bacterium]